MPRCPSCYTPMNRVEEDTLKSSTCPNCFGRWMAIAALTRRTRLDLQKIPTSNDPLPEESQAPLKDLAEMVKASNTSTILRCPQCEKSMVKQKFHPMIPVIVDRCKVCSNLWLDAGEYYLIRRLYRELMTTTDKEIIRRREKASSRHAAWDLGASSQSYTGLSPADSNASADFARDPFNFIEYLLNNPQSSSQAQQGS